MISPCIQWAPIAEVGGGGRPRGRGLYVYLGLGALASESGKHLRGEDGGACLESRVTTRYNVMCFGIKQPQPWRTPQQNGRRPQCLPELVFGSVANRCLICREPKPQSHQNFCLGQAQRIPRTSFKKVASSR